MENWIGAYRLPPNLGLGVERNNDTVDAAAGNALNAVAITVP